MTCIATVAWKANAASVGVSAGRIESNFQSIVYESNFSDAAEHSTMLHVHSALLLHVLQRRPALRHKSFGLTMPRKKAEYTFLGRKAWDSKSSDGRIFFELFQEKIVDNVRHAAALCPVKNNFDSVIKFIIKFVPELDILQYTDSSIRTNLRRLKTDALANSARPVEEHSYLLFQRSD